MVIIKRISVRSDVKLTREEKKFENKLRKEQGNIPQFRVGKPGEPLLFRSQSFPTLLAAKRRVTAIKKTGGKADIGVVKF